MSNTIFNDFFRKIKQGIKKPLPVVLKRLWLETKSFSSRWHERQCRQGISAATLLQHTGFQSIHELWEKLGTHAFPGYFPVENNFKHYFPQQEEVINQRAALACEKKINLLGSGWIYLGEDIDWQRDYKSGHRWELGLCRQLRYGQVNVKRDVKFPWELSRWQWLIPVAQRYLLHRNETDAKFVQDILLDWVAKNPYAYSINWSCAMEVSIRIVMLCWFFHVFKQAACWMDNTFRGTFLSLIYLHARYVYNHLEYTDINGNHYLANAMGLVFAGQFFLEKNDARKWSHRGWRILNNEIMRQITADGVNYEGSIAYHRLTCEMLLLPALYRQIQGLNVPYHYYLRLYAMAQFTHAYCRPDGSTPLVGDADDGRILPLGTQSLNDHRYLYQWIGWQCGYSEFFSNLVSDEIYWQCGIFAVKKMKEVVSAPPSSKPFYAGGYFVLRHEQDHVFINCGSLGLKGRGGHAHNDALSLEIMLSGELLICDSGCYVYTADAVERDLFRSTAYHNTPQIDNEEINRFTTPKNLWRLQHDAHAALLEWECQDSYAFFRGQHQGYLRLKRPVLVERRVRLEYPQRRVMISDHFPGMQAHQICVPFHLAPHVQIEQGEDGIILISNNKRFNFKLQDEKYWKVRILPARHAPSYGVINQTYKLVIENTDPQFNTLHIEIGLCSENKINRLQGAACIKEPSTLYYFWHK